MSGAVATPIAARVAWRAALKSAACRVRFASKRGFALATAAESHWSLLRDFVAHQPVGSLSAKGKLGMWTTTDATL